MMRTSGAETTKDILGLIEKLNDCWLNDKLEDLEMFFHKQVVMLEPGTNKKVAGRDLLIESYREFVEEAIVSDFRTQDMTIDVFNDTAIAFYTFRIHYRVETTSYDEKGSEILVFNRHNDNWLIVWRNQQPG